MNERISVMTDFGELIATPFAGGISVDINLPDGKSSGQLAFIEAAPVDTAMPRASAANCSRTPRLRGPMASSTRTRSRRTRG